MSFIEDQLVMAREEIYRVTGVHVRIEATIPEDMFFGMFGRGILLSVEIVPGVIIRRKR